MALIGSEWNNIAQRNITSFLLLLRNLQTDIMQNTISCRTCMRISEDIFPLFNHLHTVIIYVRQLTEKTESVDQKTLQTFLDIQRSRAF